MNFRELCKDVYSRAAPGIADPGLFVLQDRDIRIAIDTQAGLKSSVSGPWVNLDTDIIRVAVVLSDFTSIYLDSHTDMSLTVPTARTPGWSDIVVRLPQALFQSGALLEKIDYEGDLPAIRPAYAFPTDVGLAGFVRELRPLAETGRLMIRPQPVLLARTTAQTEQGGIEWKLLRVEPDSPIDQWICSDGRNQDSYPIKGSANNPTDEAELASIVLPYLTGVPLSDLALILDDEADLLAEFRMALKTVVKEAKKDGSHATDVVNDLVRPAVDKVQRKFSGIASQYAMRIGGAAVVMATLGLTSLTTGGIASAVIAVFGAGGAGIVAKELADYLKSMSELRESSLYLLWRLRRVQPLR
jgi:hypothetical protein